MKTKLLLCCLYIAFNTNLYSQKIIISGQETSRPLKWSDFTGPIDESFSFSAFTLYSLSYKWDATEVKGDSVRIIGFSATLELNPKSWVRKGKETKTLLLHEQGHFNLGIICLNELLSTVANTSLKPPNHTATIKNSLQHIINKYAAMNTLYDQHTEHGLNRKQQKNWDLSISQQLLQAASDDKILHTKTFR